MVWIKFLAAAAAILFAGVRLSRCGDRIAKRTGLGGAFIGVILLATVTSLPELVVGATASAVVGSPDLAVGGLLGSNIFNLAIIVLLDILYRSGPLLGRVHPGHILAAGLGVLFIAIVSALILFYEQGGVFEIGGVGLGSFVFLAIYLLAIRLIYRFDRHRRREVLESTAREANPAPMRSVYLQTILASALIVAAGIVLSRTGQDIAAVTGWGESFVGVLLLAAATSLPEAVVSLAAMRLGAVDMAVSNLLGSNLFNMVTVAVCDILYRKGPLLAGVGPAGVMAGLTAIVMNGIVITALIYRTQSRSTLRIGSEAVALALTYLVGSYFLFILSRP